jgi:DNA-binding NtrC family response regulator
MQQLRQRILCVAQTKLPVMIQGATGSGKELVARALHLASGRRGRLVALNVCAVGDSMFEDALFGHVRGAFTGAQVDAAGYLAEAHGGSLFLDEINGLPGPAQVKLLRALETGEFRPVGAARDRTSDFRVLAASNENLRTLANNGRFRADLLYRLGGVTLNVPTLRERCEDIPALARHLTARIGAVYDIELSDAALRALQAYDWPGNVRELKHVVDRLSLAYAGQRITASDIKHALGDEPASTVMSRPIDSFERQRLVQLLIEVDWRTDRAALLLGVDRTTVYRRMKRLGVDLRSAAASNAQEGDQARV